MGIYQSIFDEFLNFFGGTYFCFGFGGGGPIGTYGRRYMAGILPIRRKTQNNQSTDLRDQNNLY